MKIQTNHNILAFSKWYSFILWPVLLTDFLQFYSKGHCKAYFWHLKHAGQLYLCTYIRNTSCPLAHEEECLALKLQPLVPESLSRYFLQAAEVQQQDQSLWGGLLEEYGDTVAPMVADLPGRSRAPSPDTSLPPEPWVLLVVCKGGWGCPTKARPTHKPGSRVSDLIIFEHVLCQIQAPSALQGYTATEQGFLFFFFPFSFSRT